MSAASKQERISIPAADIRAGLARILESKEFKRSPRLTSFLKYIVEMTLEGSAKHLKGYTIGIEVYGKPDSFDPEQDASVRVDATRLRRVLAAYYSGQGQSEAIKISVATGTYVPSFEYQPISAPATGNRVVDGLLVMGAKGYALVALALIIVGAVLGGLVQNLLPEHKTSRQIGDISPPIEEILKRPTGPTVAVLPLKAIGNEDTAQLANGFTHQLLNDLTRFKSLRMLGRETVEVYRNLSGETAEIGSKLHADYVVEGSLQRSGEKTRIKVRLLDITSRTYIWSYASDENIRTDNVFQIQTKIVGEIAARLGQPYGVVQRMEARRLRGAGTKSFTTYKCVLAFYEYAANKSVAVHAQVRDCLERAVKETPDYTEAWALLSRMYGDEVRDAFNPGPSVENAIKRSGDAARKALETNPESPRAHQYMAAASLLRNDLPATRRHLRLALQLNPNDADILADAGWTYAQLGDWELGKSLVDKAIWLNPGHPRWYYGILFAYHYRQGRYEESLTHALAYYQPGVLFSSVALAAANGKLNRGIQAAEAVGHIADIFPQFLSNPDEQLKRWHFPDDFIDHLLDGLRAAGLELKPTG
jgi:TolB-like protein